MKAIPMHMNVWLTSTSQGAATARSTAVQALEASADGPWLDATLWWPQKRRTGRDSRNGITLGRGGQGEDRRCAQDQREQETSPGPLGLPWTTWTWPSTWIPKRSNHPLETSTSATWQSS